MASAAVQAAIRTKLTHLAVQLARHGCHSPLYQDVLRSLAVWAVPFARQSPSVGVETIAAELQQLHLAGTDLDSALNTLRLLSARVAALSSMAHQPTSCSTSSPFVKVEAKSWLLPHRSACQQHCQFAYEMHIVNRSSEAMQLLGRTWDIRELSGACRRRSSTRLMGLKPVIDNEKKATFQTGIILSSIKGSMSGSFLFQGVKSGSKYFVPVTPFALTPTAEQYNDPRYMPTAALRCLEWQ